VAIVSDGGAVVMEIRQEPADLNRNGRKGRTMNRNIQVKQKEINYQMHILNSYVLA